MFCLDDLPQEPEAEMLVEEVVKSKEQSQLLHLCMEQLHVEYRKALYLTYFEELSYKEAARVMGKNVKQITNLVYRGKQSLRRLLEQEGFTYEDE